MKILVSSIIRNIEPWADKFLSGISNMKNDNLDIEYLLIEGNSTDETYSILQKWIGDNNNGNAALVKYDLPEEMNTMDRVMASIELIADMSDCSPDIADYIMLIDADIVEIPDNMLTTLIEDMKSHKADIVAPYVLIAGTDKFYDTYVFRMNNKKFNHAPPYTPNNKEYNTPFEVDSAGVCLLFRLDVFIGVMVKNKKYRGEYQKQKTDGYLGLCRTAKLMNYRIFTNPTVRIFHANLTTYGLRWHDVAYWRT